MGGPSFRAANFAVRVGAPLAVSGVLRMALWTHPADGAAPSRTPGNRSFGRQESLGLTRDVDDEIDAFFGPR